MPFAMRKLRGKKLYRVFNVITKRITAKATSKKKAKAQLRMLNGFYYNVT